MTDPTRPLITVSLKAYLGYAETRRWLATLAASKPPLAAVDLVVLPAFTSLADARRLLAGTGISYGAQDCFWKPAGPYTGEITPDLLHELGCTYVEIGHAERRRILDENDETIGRKVGAALAHHLTPLICVGEGQPCHPADAIAICTAQLETTLDALDAAPSACHAVIGYEPIWAIGAEQPAEPSYIGEVLAGIRDAVAPHAARILLIYGGAAGPGLLAKLPQADGLFLGRSAHDPAQLARTLAEAAQRNSPLATEDRPPSACEPVRGPVTDRH